jgi:hypothetical protein
MSHPEFLGTFVMFWRFWASYWCSAPKIFVDIDYIGGFRSTKIIDALHLNQKFSVK